MDLENFKTVKRKLSAVQNAIKAALDDDNLPTERQINDFVAASKQMAEMGSSDWHAEMEAYIVQMEKFLHAISKENPQVVSEGFEALLSLKIACHRKFR